jgi:hypothetical protein
MQIYTYELNQNVQNKSSMGFYQLNNQTVSNAIDRDLIISPFLNGMNSTFNSNSTSVELSIQVLDVKNDTNRYIKYKIKASA